jgi:hypothetical protein
MIYTKQQLDMLAQRVNNGNTYNHKYFKLGADITYPHTTEWDDDTSAENNYEAIGGVDDNLQYNFKGNFDGNGHTISGIRIYKPNANNQGLFGHTDGANIHDLTLADARITGSWQTGGIVGYNQWSSTITRCHVAANVTIRVGNNDADCFGGIAGYNYTTCTIDHCTSSVKISSPYGSNDCCEYFGAITGWNQNSILSDNLAIGASVPASYSSHNYHGAICGYNSGGSEQTKLERNYYVACTVAGVQNATGVGCGDQNTTFDIIANDGAVPGNARIVDGHGGNSQAGWVFIASPVTENGGIAPNSVTNLVANTAADYDLYRFNQSAEAEWENYKAVGENNQPLHADFTSLLNGQGFLYANRNNVTLKFIGTTYNTAESQAVPLVYDETNTDPNMHGWNLVGNPFPRAAYITNMSYYKMMTDNEGSSYISATPAAASDYISPCTGVMVQATGENQSVSFTTTAPTQQNANNNGNLNVTLTQTVTTRGGSSTATLDNAIVSFNEGSQLGKFYFMQQNANLYIPQGAEKYAIAYSDGYGEMPVNFRANENGQYTITVNPEGVEMAYLHLIDNMTGADVDLLAGQLVPEPVEGPASYTFSARTTDYESRFKLVFVANNNGDGASTGSATFAFYANGSWIINNAGEATLQVIDLNGRILSSETVNGSVSKAINTVPGVYMIRLINGDNVKVQKVIIE